MTLACPCKPCLAKPYHAWPYLARPSLDPPGQTEQRHSGPRRAMPRLAVPRRGTPVQASRAAPCGLACCLAMGEPNSIHGQDTSTTAFCQNVHAGCLWLVIPSLEPTYLGVPGHCPGNLPKRSLRKKRKKRIKLKTKDLFYAISTH